MKNSSPLAVAFAPDWTQGNPYQASLRTALQDEGVTVNYIRPREWGFPLAQAAARGTERLIHLHWPEAFFNTWGRPWRVWARKVRYGFDLEKASALCPLVLTAHNLYPHQREKEWLVKKLIRTTYAKADAIIAHSAAAASIVEKEFGVDSGKLHVIPHGTWREDSPAVTQLSMAEARRQLEIKSETPFCLIYGVVSKYKGIEEAIEFWKTCSPDCDLRIIGMPKTPEYQQALESQIGGHPRIHLHAKWLADEEIVTWLWAANCVLFNYTKILTSGAAVQARAYGAPILIPQRLDTVDLMEPHPLVTRFTSFDSDFTAAVQTAMTTPPDFAQAENFRRMTSWTKVGQATASVYRKVLESRS